MIVAVFYHSSLEVGFECAPDQVDNIVLQWALDYLEVLRKRTLKASPSYIELFQRVYACITNKESWVCLNAPLKKCGILITVKDATRAQATDEELMHRLTLLQLQEELKS